MASYLEEEEQTLHLYEAEMLYLNNIVRDDQFSK